MAEARAVMSRSATHFAAWLAAGVLVVGSAARSQPLAPASVLGFVRLPHRMALRARFATQPRAALCRRSWLDRYRGAPQVPQ